MEQLVEVQRGKVFCDSQMVAEKFGCELPLPKGIGASKEA
jgi:hypothetical protein